MLYSRAATLDPHNASYAITREALKPQADLLTNAKLQDAVSASELKKAEETPAQEPVPDADPELLSEAKGLVGPEHLEPFSGLRSFHLHTDQKSALNQVAQAFGVEAIFDPDFDNQQGLRFDLDESDCETTLRALTEATNTFVFPVAGHRLFIARDSQIKRNEFEPVVVVTVPVPEATDTRDMVEAANAVRGVVGLRGAIAWDSVGRQVVIRETASKARVAESLLDALLLPKAQVRFAVQLMTVDSDELYQYGISWQNTFQALQLGLLSHLHNPTIPSLVNASNFIPFGGGATLVGIGLTEANLFANYSNSDSRLLYNASLVVANGQTSSMHVGNKYPIPTALFSGAGQSTSPSLYNPIGQVTQEDLGLSLKIAAHVHSDGDIGLDLEAEFKTLGTIIIDTVPSINQRVVKGSVNLREGQWAVIAGLQQDSHSFSKSGFPGLGALPGLDTLFNEITREHRKSETLLVIKPTITRLPMSNEISPQYLMGPASGPRVIL